MEETQIEMLKVNLRQHQETQGTTWLATALIVAILGQVPIALLAALLGLAMIYRANEKKIKRLVKK